MALPASDSFTGSNGDPLSANWTTFVGNWQIQSNHAYADTLNTPNMTRWTGDSFGADHYAQAKVGTLASGAGVGVRLSSGGNGYYIRQVGGNAISLNRMDAGVEVNLQDITGLAIADFDTLKLEIIGTTLRVYQNGVQRGTDQTDASYASGSAGMVIFGNGGPFIDDFQADNVGGTSPITWLPTLKTVQGKKWVAIPSGSKVTIS